MSVWWIARRVVWGVRRVERKEERLRVGVVVRRGWRVSRIRSVSGVLVGGVSF